jgi:hypothetical protein
VCECGDRVLEGAVEACGQCIASEDVGEACVAERGIHLRYGGQGAQGVGIGVDDALSVDAQGGDAHAVRMSGAGGNGEPLARGVEGDDAPIASGGAVCEGDAESSGGLARVGGVCSVRRGVGEDGAQAAHASRAAGEVGLADQFVDGQGAARVGGETADDRVAQEAHDGAEGVE